jgi:hypothetical protein
MRTRTFCGALLGLALFTPPLSAAEPVGPPPPPTHESEAAAVEQFLYQKHGVAVEDIDYTYFFTTFAMPKKWLWRVGEAEIEVSVRRNAELAMPFVLNSVSGVHASKFIEKPRRVPGSDTLWYFDVRDYGWSQDDLAAVFKLQPYCLTPLVESKGAGRLFRFDWFLVNATDVTAQDDRGIKDFPYYILQYGLGHEPKDKFDFLKAWEIDEEAAERVRINTGTLVDQGDSGVSRHTRQLNRFRTPRGYFHYTKDVKSHDFDPDKVQSRDYVEDVFAKLADAGEYITTNNRGLQTYMLSAGNAAKFKRVEFGDPGIVVDRQDPHDPRVRTGKSCMVCHSFGIIPYTNVFKELFLKGAKLYAKSKQLELDLKGFYLSEKGGELVKADNELFAAAIDACNGLTPEDNLKAYLSVYEWYWYQKVDIAQAALEVGVGVEEMKERLKGATTGRLVLLFHGKPMPRDIWDSVNLGGYVQSVLLVKSLGKGAEDAMKEHASKVAAEKEKRDPPPKAPDKPGKPARDDKYPYEAEVVVDKGAMFDEARERPILFMGRGFPVTVTNPSDNGWLFVTADGRKGYVKANELKRVK